MSPGQILAGFIIGFFLASWAAPRFRAVQHDHEGGERPHLHLRLSLVNGSLPYAHGHGNFDLHPLPSSADGPFLASDLASPLTHWHQFDDSIPTLAFSLPPIFPILVLAFLKSLPIISTQLPPVITRHSRGPPFPGTLS